MSLHNKKQQSFKVNLIRKLSTLRNRGAFFIPKFQKGGKTIDETKKKKPEEEQEKSQGSVDGE